MTSLFQRAKNAVLDSGTAVPEWLFDGVVYETVVGSSVYGYASDGSTRPASDTDYMVVVVPPFEVVHPPLMSHVSGFDQDQPFHSFHRAGVKTADAGMVDFTVYTLPRFLHHLSRANPNVVESLFTPLTSVNVMHSAMVYLRGVREMYLTKSLANAYTGMSRSLQAAMRQGMVRHEYVSRFGYDTKSVAHALRGQLFARMCLLGELELDRYAKELLMVVNGRYSLDAVTQMLADETESVNALELVSTVEPYVNRDAAREHLVHCLSLYFGEEAERHMR